MYGDTQLCWANSGGKTRDLELWIVFKSAIPFVGVVMPLRG